MSVGWINRTSTIFGICPKLELYLLLSMAVCRFNSLMLAVMEAQLNLLCSNTTCRPEGCLAKLRQHCKTTLINSTYGADASVVVQ